jgi:alkylated DNA repair protein alkB family protein 1
MKGKAAIVPPDDESFQNKSAFRIAERTFKRAFDINKCKFYNNNLNNHNNMIIIAPGLLLLRASINTQTQADIINLCLSRYAKPPNLTNLDAHFEMPIDGIFNTFCNSENLLIQPRQFQSSTQTVYDQTHPESKLLIDPPTDPIRNKKPIPISKVLNRLRWVTLGYQYNWTAKTYFFDRSPPFPSYIHSIVTGILHTAQQAGFIDLVDDYKSQAGIINFYHVKNSNFQPGDSLTAHQDKSEISTAPLISLSLGLECIFLIGTESTEDTPIALNLKRF